MAWRQPPHDPYKILVSEIMLQQTQVSRVAQKYAEFLKRFQTAAVLARAPLADVLAVWNGLGYNRRAKFLWQAAAKITDFAENWPTTQAEWQKLPGVGPNTAGAVLAYAFNKPVAYLETNIRTVFLHHFFQGQVDVPDSAILALVTETLPANPREWYWALMDYGAFLKLTQGNLNKASRSYAKQSRFAGSLRQVRGEVLRQLMAKPLSSQALQNLISDERLPAVLTQLEGEAMISFKNGVYQLG